MNAPTTLSVVVVYAASPDVIWQQQLQIAVGSSVEQAVVASGFQQHYPQVDWTQTGVGLFGRRVPPEHRLSEGDRVEIYCELVFDPKESRRRRALHRQRQKTAPGEKHG